VKTIRVPELPKCAIHRMARMDADARYDTYVRPFHQWGYLCEQCLYSHGMPESDYTTRLELHASEGEPNTP
jgi:hypothetical protein